ncbi:MAG: hypothetical protein EA341_07300 [Mongoliibacter sp.]|uniref:DUF4097 family beta strand repeat-containing protein n=1 Tax=Mongoliibacter sp. TaxID=2022438 RepID=UPI0012F2991A|nr:DUF4097 family beta strand repeat-containing protein [Mongoliibacter sp.]TVP50542.1 MAG: hypothetical protein EA341_07300 [Mongoliibacter sp.]
MKTIIYILLSYFLVLPTDSIAKHLNEGDPYISETFDIDGLAQLEMKTAGASIHVDVWEYDQVLVEVFVTRNGKVLNVNDPEVMEKLEEFDFEIYQENQKVLVAMRSKSRTAWNMGRNQLSFTFQIHVPERTSADLRSAGGSISLSGLDGDHSLVSSGGSISILDCAGQFDAKSSGGSFRVEHFVGSMDVSSSGGSVRVDDFVGSLIINSSGGGLNLNDIAGSLIANSSGGSIKANLLSLEGQVSLKSSGGGISATLPGGEGLDLDLRGTSSKLRLENFIGEIKGNTVKGKLNGGGIPVTMASSGGSVKLDFR